MCKLFNFIFKLVVLAIVVFLLTAVWIVFDGLIDSGQKADVVLVSGNSASPQGAARLDRVVQLYNQGEFPAVIVSGSTLRKTGGETPATMAEYLEAHGLPSSAIIVDDRGETTQDTARSVAGIMRSHQFESVMLVTDYYHMTRTKLALAHAGIRSIEKSHVGKLQKEDAMKIGREVIALYDYVAIYYLMPEAEKVRQEAQVGAAKAQVEAEKTRETVEKKIDSMAK